MNPARVLRSFVAAATAFSFVAVSAEAASAAAPAVTSEPSSVALTAASSNYTIRGRMYTAYKRVGGKRAMGTAVGPTRCSLPERGCLQTFQKGTLYLQRNGKVWRTRTTGVRGDILIVARSQVGFRQKNLKVKTKYSKYTGEVATRWCNDFHSWTAYAAGHREVIPKIPNYGKMKKWMRANWKKLRKPVRGAYVILNGSKYQSHMAVVWSVHKGNKITILEGNWGYSVMMRRISVAKSMEFRYPY